MKGAIDTLILIFMIIGSILAAFLILPSMLENIGKNYCIRDQFNEIRNIEEIAKEMGLGMSKSTGFDVKWCTKCIWYESNETHKWLKVWIKDEPNPQIRYVENVYYNIGTKQSESKLNKDDFEYSFWIKKGEVNCTNCYNETITPGC